MAKNILADKILIIDFGSQYTQLIARRVRELGVYCEIYNHRTSLKSIKDFNAKGIILFGVDFSNKTVVFGDLFSPSGDKDKDLRLIKDYFDNFTAKRPELS